MTAANTLNPLFEKSVTRQAIAFTLVSFLFLLPLYLHNGPNIVFHTMLDGAARFWAGQDPYGTPTTSAADLFFYSPFFAFGFGIFLLIPKTFGVLLWALLNIFIFWSGVVHWISFDRKRPWIVIGFLLCGAELDISMRYQQSNALLVGLTLLGLYAFESRKPVASGILLALAANLKIVPGVFALGLFVTGSVQFILSFLISSAVLTLVPGVAVGFPQAFQLTIAQFKFIASDMETRSLNDIYSVLSRLGYPQIGAYLSRFIAPVGGILLVWGALKRDTPRTLWYGVGMVTALLLIKRVESPTFVWMAPCLIFLMAEKDLTLKWGALIAGLATTFIYTALWPQSWRLPSQHLFETKTLGTLLIWLLLFYQAGAIQQKRLSNPP